MEPKTINNTAENNLESKSSLRPEYFNNNINKPKYNINPKN